MPAARLILVKHAMPQIREDAPSKDWLLSDEGRLAAAALAERLGRLGPKAVVASTEPKATETGKILADTLRAPLALDAGFVETRRETVGFLPREALEAGICSFFADAAGVVFGEESADEAFARFSAALARHSNETPLVVACHGTVISLYLSRTAGVDAMATWRSLKLPHALVLGEDGQVLESIAVD